MAIGRVRSRTRTVLIAVSAVSALVAALAVAATEAGATPAARQAALTGAQAAQLSQNVNRPVIVILKDQPGQVQAGRADAISLDQDSLMSELAQVHATHIKRYQLVNAFAATVSAGEETRLSASPLVREVIPDVTLQYDPDATASPARSSRAKGTRSGRSLPLHNIPGACGPGGQVQLAPEGL